MNVFVYGTLMRGNRFYDKIEPFVEEIRPACVRGVLYMAKHADFPVFIQGKGIVFGEVFSLDRSTAWRALKLLDQIECVPTLFTREIIETDRHGLAYIYTGKSVELGHQLFNGRFTQQKGIL